MTQFILERFNPIRKLRGAPAAEVRVIYEGGEEVLWMHKSDIHKNIRLFGTQPGLHDALEAYRLNRHFDRLGE